MSTRAPDPTRGATFGLLLTYALLLGCNADSADERETGSGQASPKAVAGTSSPIAVADVNLTVGDEKTLAAMIEKQKGKVVFVDYWATWCPPCVEYFPHTVELSDKYRERGLATIGVTFDTLDETDKVRAFLAEKGARFENLISQYDGAGTEANTAFEIDQVPHFRLYDRQGKLRHKWDEKPKDAEQKIEELLAEKAE